MSKKPRNFKKEYKKWQSSPKQIADRAARNKARRAMVKAGKAKKGDGKDVAHKDSNPRNNSKTNLTMQSVKTNRGRLGEGGRKRKKKKK